MRKLKDNSGATILIALLFFMVCAMAGSVVLAAATSASGRLTSTQNEENAYYAVQSAASLLKDEIAGQRLSSYYYDVESKSYFYNEEPSSDIKEAIKKSFENAWNYGANKEYTDKFTMTVSDQVVTCEYTMKTDYSISMDIYYGGSKTDSKANVNLEIQAVMSQNNKVEEVLYNDKMVNRHTTTLTWLNPVISQK